MEIQYYNITVVVYEAGIMGRISLDYWLHEVAALFGPSHR